MNTALTAEKVSLGSLAKRSLHTNAVGETIGVFSSAIYFTVGGEVLLLCDAFYGEVPFGISLSDVRAFLQGTSVGVGAPVRVSETELCFGDIRLPIEIVPAPPRIECSPTLPSAERIAALRDYVAAHGAQGGILALGARAEHLIPPLCAFDKTAAEKLIGLGRGLTPSGDDFLCGFFTCLAAAGALSAKADACRRHVLAHLDRTSAISGAYLRRALEGEYFTVYAAAARAALSAEPFEADCDFLFQMGASSGTDTLLGAIAAAETLRN